MMLFVKSRRMNHPSAAAAPIHPPPHLLLSTILLISIHLLLLLLLLHNIDLAESFHHLDNVHAVSIIRNRKTRVLSTPLSKYHIPAKAQSFIMGRYVYPSSRLLFQSLFPQQEDEEEDEEYDKKVYSITTQEEQTNQMEKLENNNNLMLFTRPQALRVLLLLGGGTAYINLAITVFQKIQRGGENVYPIEHESRASDTFNIAMINSFSSLIHNDVAVPAVSSSVPAAAGGGNVNVNANSTSRPIRMLEIGIGSSCRTINRGTYDAGFENMARIIHSENVHIPGVEFVGVDIDIPKDESVVENSRKRLVSKVDGLLPITLDVRLADITKGLPFPDGYFDVITTSLVLCSVDDQYQAIHEIKRVLNPNGGTFGFIEHVAVDLEREDEKDLGFLDWQQQKLDPLQQLVAHNCHLHRSTDKVIEGEFFNHQDGSSSRWLQRERFQVKDMWPVSCQSRGVVQLYS